MGFTPTLPQPEQRLLFMTLESIIIRNDILENLVSAIDSFKEIAALLNGN